MADIEAAAMVAPPQLAPPTWRSAAATSMAWALSRFLSLASHVAICFLLGASWTCSNANAIRIAAHWGFGAGSPWEALAEYYFDLSVYAVILLAAVAFILAMALFLHCFIMARLLRRRWRREGTEIAAARDSGARTTVAAQEGAAGHEGDDPADGVSCFITVPMQQMFIGLLMVIFAPARGSSEERLGYGLIDAGFFLASLTYCNVMFPSILTKVISEWDKVRKISDLLTSFYLDG